VSEENIMARLHRLLSSADERDLDETECRCIRDAIFEIKSLCDELILLQKRNTELENLIDSALDETRKSK